NSLHVRAVGPPEVLDAQRIADIQGGVTAGNRRIVDADPVVFAAADGDSALARKRTLYHAGRHHHQQTVKSDVLRAFHGVRIVHDRFPHRGAHAPAHVTNRWEVCMATFDGDWVVMKYPRWFGIALAIRNGTEPRKSILRAQEW